MIDLDKFAGHTPGPWEIAQYDEHFGFSIWALGAGCIAERWYPSERTDIPTTANAALIKAAPDLLRELSTLRGVAEEMESALRIGIKVASDGGIMCWCSMCVLPVGGNYQGGYGVRRTHECTAKESALAHYQEVKK